MQTVEQFFNHLKDEYFYYFPNPGNAGDSLIALGTYNFFKKNGIKYTLISPKYFDPTNKNIIYGGGGNLAKKSTYSAKLLSDFHKKAKRTIILPHTIKDVDSLIIDFDSSAHVFCREKFSYEYVKTLNPLINTYLDHDMAFHTDMNSISAESQSLLFIKNSLIFALNKLHLTPLQTIEKKHILRLIKYNSIINNIIKYKSDNGVLNAFRLDGEKTNIQIPSDNFDISELLALGVENEQTCEYVVSKLFYILNQFDLIKTNRLHIAISCALLGKNVEFYPNNYFKCSAVYNYSIKNKYPNVKWMGD